MITKNDISTYKETIPTATDEQLIWLYKVCISKDKDKKDFEKLAEHVQKERKKRGTITSISSKVVQPKLSTEKKDTSTAYAYENE